jgi:hypothetical protein
MPEAKTNQIESATNTAHDYQAPAIEEIVTPDNLEREVAYAGVPAPSNLIN